MLRPSFLHTALFVLLAGCGSVVTSPGDGGSSSTGTSTGCDGNGPDCWGSCDYAESAICEDGQWSCPPGTSTSYPGGCDVCEGDSGACDTCYAPFWQCEPTDVCLAGCPEIACLDCTGAGSYTPPPGCSCQCDPEGRLACAKTPGCCKTSEDCGDLIFTPCVNGVCKTPVGNGQCWVSEECTSGTSCVGASVCPCGASCTDPDTPGFCEGPP